MLRTLALAGSMIAAVGCSHKPTARGESYTVRGKITAMPQGAESKEIEIHHEAIPTFRNQQGKVAGMMSMPMPFAVGSGVSLTGLAVSDKVSFTFEVVWDDRSPLHLLTLSKLPQDTALTLE